jgi:DnaJ family protein C protein 28
MEEGHFENLPGKGKPLNLDSNPHADPAEDTLYRILSRNGCAPEWVELNKEIRGMIASWRSALKKAWANQSEDDGFSWNDDCRVLQEQIRQINDKVLLRTYPFSLVEITHEMEMIRRSISCKIAGFPVQPDSTFWAADVWSELGQGGGKIEVEISRHKDKGGGQIEVRT